MNFTINNFNIQSSVLKIFDIYPLINAIIKVIHENQGIAYLVGGTVRDILMGKEIKTIKDIDIEIHNLTIQELNNILSEFGPLRLAGKSFGVFKLDNLPADWSLPRTDKKGRKPEVCIDPNMNIKEALKRRDLTINAMAINLYDFKFIDPFNGYKDILDKTLRSPDLKFFTEDPLRFYRVMQFIGRFKFCPDSKLNEVCKLMDIKNISKERIEEEFNKLMLKGLQPSLGIRWLKTIDRIKEILPELANTIGVEQEYEWHPEGDVFEHSMETLDAAAKFDYKDKQKKLIITYAAMCHDLGKATTTKYIKGKIRSWGHDIAGYPLTKKLLNRIITNKTLIEKVATLVKWHMQPLIFIKVKAKSAAYKRLAIKLYKKGLNVHMLGLLALADRQGRNPKGCKPLDIKPKEVEEFIDKAKRLNIEYEPENPILLGRDLIDIIKPGPLMGKVLDYVYKKQIENNIKDKYKLKQIALREIEKLKE